MKIIILGCGSQAKVVWSILSLVDDAEILGFVDACNNRQVWGKTLLGAKILGGMADLHIFRLRGAEAAVPAFGDNQVRQQIAAEATIAGLTLISAVHPTAVISSETMIGRGVVVGPNAIINIHASVGDNAIINSGAIVEHDCTIGNGAHIAPGAKLAGNVTVGPGTLVGIGATVIQGITIGTNVTIGAGAVVIRDVPDKVTVVGVPASPLSKRRIPAQPILV